MSSGDRYGSNDGEGTRVTVASAGSTEIAPVRPTRRRLTIVNRDSTNYIDINIGGNAAVNDGDFQLSAGESIVVHTKSQVNGIADTSDVVVHIIDEYDS